MSSTKNPQKFLWIKYQGEHDMKVIRFGRFMLDASSNFETLMECRLCGVQQKRMFVSEDELLAMGVSIEEIVERRSQLF